MLVLSRDGAWLSRLKRLAERGGWLFEARAALPALDRTPPSERAIAVLDRELAGAALAKAVAVLRVLYPAAAVALAFENREMGPDAMTVAVSCGADEVLGKTWSDEKISARLAALRDRTLAAQTRLSADGMLRAERRSFRAFVCVRGRWKETTLDAGGFALLWRLMEREGELVSRADLGRALTATVGREIEIGTVSRRLAALKKALAPWPGMIESGGRGLYRLVSAKNSTTASTKSQVSPYGDP